MAQRINYKRDKRQRELKRQEKAQAKLQKRLARSQRPDGAEPTGEGEGPPAGVAPEGGSPTTPETPETKDED